MEGARPPPRRRGAAAEGALSARADPERPWVGVAALAIRGGEVLLVRRARPPNLGAWTLPGGAQRLGETVEAAARRELLEETGVTVGPLRLIEAVDVIERDADGRVAFHYTVLDLAGPWRSGEPRAASDAAEARFWRPEDLPALGASEATRRVVAAALRGT